MERLSMTKTHLLAAADALRQGRDAVFLPAEDGGYVLVGLRCAEPGLFTDMPWGGPAVMEEKFVAAGDGVDRVSVLRNDFVIVGPPDDPVGVRTATGAVGALEKVAIARAGFVSRGDESDAHTREKALWKDAGIRPEGLWYLSAGQEGVAALRIAEDKWAYTLTDQHTYLALRHQLSLALLYEGSATLLNSYRIMAVNPDKHKNVNYPLAKAYIDYVTGKQGQALIAGFHVNGKSPFIPDVGKP